MEHDEALAQAIELHRAGQLAQAEPLYRSALARSPARHDIQYLLALNIYQLRNDPEAIDLIRRAITANPNESEYYCNLGVILAANRQFEEALSAYQKALDLNPNSGETHNNVGNALLHLGRIQEAADACRRAVECMPDSVLGRYNLGNALVQLDQPEAAIAEYRAALALNPKFPEAHSNLGNALSMLGRFHEAADACRAAIQLRPTYAAAHNNLASALTGLGQAEEAIIACTQAIQFQPNYPDAYVNLGNALKDLRRFDEATAAYVHAISLRPDHAPFHSNLGVALLQAGKPDEAMIHIQRALVLAPNLAGAHNNLGGVLKDMGRIPEAVDAYRRALELDPKARTTRDNLILAAHYHPDYDATSLRREAQEWAKIHADPLYSRIHPHVNDRNPQRPLRVGYVSPDFRDHVARHTLLPLLRGHDRARFTIHCYSNVRHPDAITHEFQSFADQWRNIHARSDEDVAAQIREDKIDILVDLALFTAGNRLRVFALKPAPVQVTYLAYPGTTGLKTMDYRLSDPYIDPADSDLAAYTEKTLRLPRTYWLYDPEDGHKGVRPHFVPAPARIIIKGSDPILSDPPAIAAGYITFGCLNNVAKLSRPALNLLADLLARVPNSRLLIHSASADHQQSVMSLFSKRGIDPARITFIAKNPWPKYLDSFRQIDIALDPFPYGGGITTCDTLWMGVPVVTLSGATAVGRGGRSILSNIGLPEFIASSPDDYLRIAADLAADLPRLSDLRRTLRDRMRSSPLMNAPAFVTDIENAFRQMWQTWCAESR